MLMWHQSICNEALILFISPHKAPEPSAQDRGVTDRSYNRMGWINSIPASGCPDLELGTSSLIWSGSQDSANSSVSLI
jgi:hypothetical protein